MSTRMDKYEIETPEYKKRTERNKELYDSYETINYDKFDVNSNREVLKKDAKNIDVDQIRDMLDRKYREDMPKRKSIDVQVENITKPDDFYDDTKEYDINLILEKAKNSNNVDYDSIRYNNVDDGNRLINEINNKYSKCEREDTEEEKELMNLINTITELEIKNSSSDAELLDLADDTVEIHEPTSSIDLNKTEENTFYTGSLAVTENDFEDFKDMEKDIKSNSILLRILIILFILIAIAIGVVICNKVFNLGLF